MKTVIGLLLFCLAAVVSNSASALVITGMTTGGGYHTYGQFGRELLVMGTAKDYFLDDGSSWQSGAGSAVLHYADLDNYFISGSTINYVLNTTIGSTIYNQTDYNFGVHSSQGTLATTDYLVLQAEIGSTIATLSGWTEVTSNDETWYGEPRFNYFAADVGDIVAFDVTYNLLGGSVWNERIFDGIFKYQLNGIVDFTDIKSVPEPSSILLMLSALTGLLYRRKLTKY